MLQRAGLDAHVEVRAGDALETLSDITWPIDLLFLDGANHLYRDVLELVMPRLSPHAVIAADMSEGDLDHDAYRAHVNDPSNRLISTEIAVDAGLVISTPASG
jgi:predicted O-methyltransferase YrrM